MSARRLVALALVLAMSGLAPWAVVAPAPAEVGQQGGVRVAFHGKLTPRSLPRSGTAPVRVAVGARITPLAGATPPPLRQITIEINRYGRLERRGLPACSYRELQPTTTADALRVCGDALVGRGHFSSNVLVPEEAPFPAAAELDAFNGTYRGRPAILAHIYGTSPGPISYTIPFSISSSHGDYGLKLTAPMPDVGSEWGYVTGLSLNLGRSFRAGGERRAYLAAKCPAPAGVSVGTFNFARASFDFGATTVRSTLVRSCRAKG
jgi:hypothetical protein